MKMVAREVDYEDTVIRKIEVEVPETRMVPEIVEYVVTAFQDKHIEVQIRNRS